MTDAQKKELGTKFRKKYKRGDYVRYQFPKSKHIQTARISSIAKEFPWFINNTGQLIEFQYVIFED